MLEPVGVHLLHTVVRNRLENYITDQGLMPGDRLPTEKDLARQLQVSRNVVREALKGMEAIGLVEARKGTGTVVGRFDAARYMSHYSHSLIAEGIGLDELVEVRKALELAFVGRAAEQIGPDDLRELDGLVAEMERLAAAGQTTRAPGLRIHKTIYRCLHNHVLAGLLEAFGEINRRIDERSDIHESAQRLARDVEIHSRLVQAMHQHDRSAARAALEADFAPEHAISWLEDYSAPLLPEKGG